MRNLNVASVIYCIFLLAYSPFTACVIGMDLSTDMRGHAKEIFSDPQMLALALAAERGDVNRMEQLISQGVDVNVSGRFGITPLWWAIRTRNKTGFAYLLAHGAQPNPKVDTITVMEMAAGYEDSYFLEAALPYKPDIGRVGGIEHETPLEVAISQRNRRNVELLIRAGADLNNDDLGEAPLHRAAKLAAYDLVFTLLQAGADPTKTFPPNSGTQGNRLTAIIAMRRIDPDSEVYEWRERVIAILQKRGISACRPVRERPRTRPLSEPTSQP